jgi:hypothetical protein
MANHKTNYTAAPNEAKYDKRLDSSAKLLLWEIFSHSVFWGSKTRLAEKLGISRTKIVRSFKLLESTGWITKNGNNYTPDWSNNIKEKEASTTLTAPSTELIAPSTELTGPSTTLTTGVHNMDTTVHVVDKTVHVVDATNKEDNNKRITNTINQYGQDSPYSISNLISNWDSIQNSKDRKLIMYKAFWYANQELCRFAKIHKEPTDAQETEQQMGSHPSVKAGYVTFTNHLYSEIRKLENKKSSASFELPASGKW